MLSMQASIMCSFKYSKLGTQRKQQAVRFCLLAYQRTFASKGWCAGHVPSRSVCCAYLCNACKGDSTDGLME
jgi:hypothetical protein